jgi:hypothetical protein
MSAGCPITNSFALDALTSHVSRGPAGSSERSGKLAASILAVSRHFPALAVQEAGWRADAQIRPLLELDRSYDNSEQIATEWLAAIQTHFLKLGKRLAIPGAP